RRRDHTKLRPRRVRCRPPAPLRRATGYLRGGIPVSAPATAVLLDLDETLTDRPASLSRFAEVFAAAYAQRLAPIEAAELAGLVVAADGSSGGRRAPPGTDRHDLV